VFENGQRDVGSSLVDVRIRDELGHRAADAQSRPASVVELEEEAFVRVAALREIDADTKEVDDSGGPVRRDALSGNVARMEWLRQQQAVALPEALFAIETLSGLVGAFDLEVKRPNAQGTTLRLYCLEDAGTKAGSTKCGLDEEIVDECIAPVELEAEAEGDGNVADGNFSLEDEPKATEARVLEQRGERAARETPVERIARLGIELAHERRDQVEVFASCETDRGACDR